jgi:hypothetical protein
VHGNGTNGLNPSSWYRGPLSPSDGAGGAGEYLVTAPSGVGRLQFPYPRYQPFDTIVGGFGMKIVKALRIVRSLRNGVNAYTGESLSLRRFAETREAS